MRLQAHADLQLVQLACLSSQHQAALARLCLHCAAERGGLVEGSAERSAPSHLGAALQAACLDAMVLASM